MCLSDRDLAQAIDHALEDLLRYDPVQSSQVGHSAHDGAFADFSAEGRRARRRVLAGHAHILEVRHGQGQGPEVELDRRLMLDELKVVLRTEEDIDPARRNPALYVEEVLNGINLLLMRPPLLPRLGALLGRLRAVVRVLSQAREELCAEDVPRIWAETGIAMARAGLALLTESVPAAVHEAVGDTPLQAAVSAAAGEAALHLGAYANFVEEHVLPAAAGDFAAGDSYFKFLLHVKHGILQDPEELAHLGRREIERLGAALSERAGRLRPGLSWQQCLLELDREDPAVAPGSSLLMATTELCEKMRLTTAGICALPEAEALQVVETPAFARPLVPYAAYWPPPALRVPAAPGATDEPFADEGLTGVFWVTPEGNGYKVSRSALVVTCLHEAYPGHHLQFCHAAKSGSRVRRVIGTPVFWEGWALYSESLHQELGLSDEAIAMHVLRGQLWRAVRVVLDVGLHVKGMEVEQAVSLLVQTAGLPRTQAEQEVRRYVQTPTQPLTYLIGYHAFCHLRREAETRAGAAFSLPAFHTQVLSHGSIPLGYLHERMRH